MGGMDGRTDGRTDGRRVTPPGRGQHNKQCEAGYTDLQPPMLLTSSIWWFLDSCPIWHTVYWYSL